MDLATYTTTKAPKKAVRKAAKPKRVRLDTTKTILLHETLKAALKSMDNGRVSYRDEQSDATVAEALGINENHVLRHRLKMFGKLHFENSYVPYSVLLSRVTDLEQRLADLERQLGVTS